MHFTTVFTLAAALAGSALATPAAKRQIADLKFDSPAAISAPPNDTAVAQGSSFPFGLTFPVPHVGSCAGGFSPVDVYILASEPDFTSLNDSFQFSDYLFYYGQYIVGDGSIPEGAQPPPSTLTTPDLGAAFDGQKVWLSTVEQIFDCGGKVGLLEL